LYVYRVEMNLNSI